MNQVFSSLSIRNFRLFFTGQVISNTGTWMQRVAQDWLVLELTHGSGVALGITTGLQFLPTLLFGLYAGVLADRYPKRSLLIATQSVMGALSLVLGTLVVTGAAQVWHVYLLALLLGFAAAADTPARQAFVTEMVGSAQVSNAVSLNSAAFNGARIMGPAVAGVLINIFSTGPVFFINAVSYIAVIASLVMMRESELIKTAVVERSKGLLREGLSYVRRRPDLMLPIVLVAIIGTFGMNFQITTALMAREQFGRGAGSFGLLTTSLAVGCLIGALVSARRTGTPRQLLLVGSGIAFGAMETIASVMPTYLTFMILLVPTGAMMVTFSMAANATLQLGSAPRIRGRVMALYALVFVGGAPIGSPMVGWIGQVLGPRWSILSGGVISLVAASVAAILIARRNDLRVRARIRSHPHLRIQQRGRIRTETEVALDARG